MWVSLQKKPQYKLKYLCLYGRVHFSKQNQSTYADLCPVQVISVIWFESNFFSFNTFYAVDAAQVFCFNA